MKCIFCCLRWTHFLIKPFWHLSGFWWTYISLCMVYSVRTLVLVIRFSLWAFIVYQAGRHACTHGQGFKDVLGWLSNDSQNCNTNDLENEMEQNVTCPRIAPSLANFQSRKIDFHHSKLTGVENGPCQCYTCYISHHLNNTNFQNKNLPIIIHGPELWATGQLVKGFTCEFVQVKEVARAMTANNLKL